MMRLILKALLVLAPLFLVYAVESGQEQIGPPQGQKKDPPKVDLKLPTHAPGKEVQYKHTELKKFDKPVVIYPQHRPPEKKGGSWHWHQSYGWVFLTINAPTTVLLPLSYQLPETVIVYLPEPVFTTVTCPHCGQVFQVQIK